MASCVKFLCIEMFVWFGGDKGVGGGKDYLKSSLFILRDKIDILNNEIMLRGVCIINVCFFVRVSTQSFEP